MTTVTRITSNAGSCDDLTPADYRDIYVELSQGRSLRTVVQMLGAYSPTWWNQFAAGGKPLTRDARQALRHAVGLPPLPPTIDEVTAAVDPDATVYRIGEAPADRLLLVGSDTHEPLHLRLNGSVEIVDEAAPQESNVTGVTSSQRRSPRKTLSLNVSTWERLSAARCEANQTWDEFISGLLR